MRGYLGRGARLISGGRGKRVTFVTNFYLYGSIRPSPQLIPPCTCSKSLSFNSAPLSVDLLGGVGTAFLPCCFGVSVFVCVDMAISCLAGSSLHQFVGLRVSGVHCIGRNRTSCDAHHKNSWRHGTIAAIWQRRRRSKKSGRCSRTSSSISSPAQAAPSMRGFTPPVTVWRLGSRRGHGFWKVNGLC